MDEFLAKYILIIDDNSMNLLLTSRILENYGFRTGVADSGIAGIAAIENEIPDLLLLDISMPDMDGYEVCEKIKEVDKWVEIPIIFLTANIQTDDLVRGFKVGGVDYITKPFKTEELLVRVKNHLELAASRKKIVEMNKTRDRLYSIIAHDIRSPLSGIQQTIDAIEQGYFDPTSDDFKDLIHHLGIRTRETSTLLTSLLQWTRLQSDVTTIIPKKVSLQPLLVSCVQLLDAVAKSKGITILLDKNEGVEAYCDEVSMHTVFRNIISNAIKFTHNNGTIFISCNDGEKMVEVVIRDTGVGMSAETIEKIFEKNHHFTSSGTDNEQGTGLGLMLVKDFVKKNNGLLAVESVVDEGTTFVVSLPKKIE